MLEIAKLASLFKEQLFHNNRILVAMTNKTSHVPNQIADVFPIIN